MEFDQIRYRFCSFASERVGGHTAEWAAVLAGLVPDNESGHARLSFVTEGEAS